MKVLALAFAGSLFATAAFAGNSAPSQSTWHTPGPGAAYHGESYKNNAVAAYHGESYKNSVAAYHGESYKHHTVAAVGPSGYNNVVTASYAHPEAGGAASQRSIEARSSAHEQKYAAVGSAGYDNIVIASYAAPEAGNSFSRA